MRGELVAAEKAHAAHEAVQAFARAGLLEGEAAKRAEALFPEPGPRAGWIGHALAALVVSGAIGMLTFFLAVASGVRSLTGISFVVCALLAAATEAILRAPRFAFSGAAGTAAFWAWVALLLGLFAAFGEKDSAFAAALPIAALAAAVAGWRWGVPLHGLLAAGALFLWLARLPSGRLLWVVVALLVASLLGRALDRPAAPSHRDALALALATSLSALYAALNVWSVEEKLVENLGSRSAPPGIAWLVAAWWATLLLPLLVVAWGLRTRRRWLLGLGGLFAVLTAITFRKYVHLAPLWELLVLAGTALALLALGGMRFLQRRGEARGFTDEPLLERPGRAEAAGIAVLLASQAPHGAPAAPRAEEGSRFASGGGASGGGGASDDY